MSPLLSAAIAGCVVIAVGVFVWSVGVVLRRRNRSDQLAELPNAMPEGGWPNLAILFAARNEAGSVAEATRSMLAQDYPGLEVIAVDDRSNDGTGAILDAIAAEDPRLRVVHIEALPPGWLGKNHALQVASGTTSAEWLLFTDADVVFEPLALRRAVAFAVTERIDHLVVAPETVTVNQAERIFLTMFCLFFALRMPPWKVADPRSKVAFGVGAFNLVRAEAFRAIGGFQRLALTVDDDIRLGQALKFAGFRPALVMGLNAVSVRWQVGLRGMIRGLEKNFFAVLDFRLVEVLVATVVMIGLGILPFVAVFVGPLWSRALAFCGIVLLSFGLRAAQGQNGIAWYHAFVLPIGALTCLVAMFRSVYVTLSRGGVRWRDHFYPLRELRQHVGQRNAWLREVWLSTH